MATAAVDDCAICMNSFNSSHRQSVTLPCGHDFCLTCLVRLKASGKRLCPTCRDNWTGFDVPALPGMEALAAALQADQEDEGDIAKKKGLFDRCEKHSMPYDYWVTGTTEFFCRRCAKENRHVSLELIEDAIPQVREALAAKLPNALKKIECDLEYLDEMLAFFVKKRNCAHEFVKEAMALDDNFMQNIEQITVFRSQVLNTAVEMKKMKNQIHNIQTAGDINFAAECKFTLERVVRPLTFPSSNLPQSLLCNIACSYVEGAANGRPPPRASFVNALLKGSSLGPLSEATFAATPSSKACSSNQLPTFIINSPKPSLEREIATMQLTRDKDWTVDNNNCEAALLALADMQPRVLTLVARDDAREALPVGAVARAAKGCEVRAKFVDTFYSADNTHTDAERLEQLTANQSLRLLTFFGHLDHSAIVKLPHTIAMLGLAIGSAVDAAAVSGLRPWVGLIGLHVSLSSHVAAKDLKPLTSGSKKILYFPSLSDAGVENVRPAIEALAPDLRIISLHFPKSQLTAAGARRLTKRLQGVSIEAWVTIEANGTWRPREGEMASVAAELRSATGCYRVQWDMDWIYCKQRL